MLETISWILIPFITYFVDCYIFCKLINQEYRVESKNVILIAIAAIINYYFRQNYSSGIMMFITNVELVCLLKVMYNKSVVKILIFTLILLVTYTISELIYAMITMFLLGVDQSVMVNTLGGQFLTNMVIIAIGFCFFKIKRVLKLFQTITNWYKDNNFINTVILVIIAITTIAALLYPISAHAYSFRDTCIYIIFLLCTIIFVTGFFTQKSRNYELSTEYDHLLDYVKVYEKELNDKAKIQHEYKNQLVLLKDMVKTKKAIEYIDNLLHNENGEKNIDLLNSLKFLPAGGLKGLIYFKIDKITYNDFEVHINIDSKLEKNKYWKTCVEQLNDVSKIVGVFLDNAIEALEKEKEKYLILDVDYEDEMIIFTFSNTCTQKVDFNKMELEGYSTKGTNHGYGLPLVKDITEKNPLLDTKKEINGKFFVQHLYIHNKK